MGALDLCRDKAMHAHLILLYLIRSRCTMHAYVLNPRNTYLLKRIPMQYRQVIFKDKLVEPRSMALKSGQLG